jgi:hypothetical protein
MQNNTYCQYFMKKAILIQIIPTTSPLSKKMPNFRMIALAQNTSYEKSEICCLMSFKYSGSRKHPLARNLGKHNKITGKY